ncbi:antitoxin TumA [Candidatus Thiosymbion oneisti]|uniref:antitoxin TumA n=1 Tax=Candidatus Thiosymbion oneisti TaxID=589554 RepID=UPI001C40483E|nr:hypothetical protein [Candidatus Thiosymbion oneisti]
MTTGMRKQRTEYSSPLDALVAITKRLSLFESQRSMSSEEFFDRYSKGQLPDEADLIDWVNDYRHYLALKAALEKQLRHAA